MEKFTPEEVATLNAAIEAENIFNHEAEVFFNASEASKASSNIYNFSHTCAMGTPALVVDETEDCYACNRDGLSTHARGLKRPHSPELVSTETKQLQFPQAGYCWAPERIMEYNRIKEIMFNYAYNEGNYPTKIDLYNWKLVANRDAEIVWDTLSCINDLD